MGSFPTPGPVAIARERKLIRPFPSGRIIPPHDTRRNFCPAGLRPDLAQPFVWLQLIWLRRAQRRHGCELLIDVCHVSGRIRVLRLGDAPRTPGLYHYEAPRITAWQRACNIVRAGFLAAATRFLRDSTIAPFGKPSCLYSAVPGWPDTA